MPEFLSTCLSTVIYKSKQATLEESAGKNGQFEEIVPLIMKNKTTSPHAESE